MKKVFFAMASMSVSAYAFAGSSTFNQACVDEPVYEVEAISELEKADESLDHERAVSVSKARLFQRSSHTAESYSVLNCEGKRKLRSIEELKAWMHDYAAQNGCLNPDGSINESKLKDKLMQDGDKNSDGELDRDEINKLLQDKFDMAPGGRGGSDSAAYRLLGGYDENKNRMLDPSELEKALGKLLEEK